MFSTFSSLFSLNGIFVSIVICILAAIFCKKKYNYWASRGVQGPTPFPFLGNLLDLMISDVPSILVRRAKKYGKAYGAYEGLNPGFVIAESSLIKQVCVKDFNCFVNRRKFVNFHEILECMVSSASDEQWKRLRKIISPTFTTGKIKRMKPLMEVCCRNATDFLEEASKRKEMIQLKQFWARFTSEVIARCCFAANVNSHKETDNVFFKNVNELFKALGGGGSYKFLIFMLTPKVILKYIPIKFVPDETIDYFSHLIRHLIKERKEKGGSYNDFLQLLLEAEKDDDSKAEGSLTENEIIGNCILFFTAGYETTATTLHYCSYALAMNPDIQEKLFQEISDAFPDPENVDYETANKLPYLDAVVCETLRMYPPLTVTERTANQEVVLEGVNVKIPKEMRVAIPIYAIHHDPEYYPEPEKFNPDRFFGENRDAIDPYTYLPFGIGPRNCMATRFALIEAKLALIKTLQKFKIKPNSKTPSKLEFNKFNGFLICNDIFVDVEKRE